jgi:putative ABC transport system permease protein
MQELIRLAVRAIVGHRLRSALSMVGIAIGIASVILLTSIGEGTRVYLISQFTQFGTNLVAINPGKAETMGMPGALGGTTHKLTIDDSEALTRIPGVDEVVPVTFGMARVEAGGRGRSVIVYGATAEAPEVWKWAVQVGSFWPPGDPRRGPAQAVLGAKLKRELFGNDSALGEFVKIAGARYRVVGLMEPKGMFLGFDLDDSAWIPVSEAMRIFNLEELQEIDLTIDNSQVLDAVIERIRVTLTERHDGKEDFTITSQAAMLEVFDNIMNIITMGVGAIAVGERTQEIGLVRSIGATRKQVQLVFLTEAAVLSTLGGLLGVAVGLGLCALLRTAVPGLPVQTPMVYVVMAVAISLAMGLASGVTPAKRAAELDPIEALRAE